ncbi:hypothetical protein DE146DRAFT_625377 [Phaeosphaeria sp. MPI-PUGE-AT-0046c]|nr:hypothetical protein DE146DRAFT_625377 [Phaeosphaeria sp. MPI-PUGE-AT-0046c]
MWAEVDGERKKVACCERIVINYTIPKSSECACPSERAQSVASVAGASRIQKNRRKSTAINTTSLERALRAGQDTETDTSSYTRTPTERSGSNEASPLSSASSTPRLVPAQKGSGSSCCQPKAIEQPVQRPAQQGGCCGSKAKQPPEPLPVKSCCSGNKPQTNVVQNSQQQPHAQPFGQQFQFQVQPQGHPSPYSNLQSFGSAQPSLPFGLGAPIYNHAAAAYHQSSSVPMSPITNVPMSPHIAGPQLGQHVPEHNCHCGESCSCFGCAAHPNNATMMEYVRLMAQFQYTGGFGTMPPPLYDVPTYPHHPGFGAEANPPINFNMNSFSTPTPTQMSFNANMSMVSVPNTPIIAPNAWQKPNIPASSMHAFEPSGYLMSTPTTEAPLSLKIEEPAATPAADSPSDGKDENSPTLSPSSYFWNQMVLPGCNDATGTCQCGDGCECVGCLTHGGHNGVQLEAPAISDTNTFPDFSTDTTGGLHLDGDSSHFLFDPAPA